MAAIWRKWWYLYFCDIILKLLTATLNEALDLFTFSIISGYTQLHNRQALGKFASQFDPLAIFVKHHLERITITRLHIFKITLTWNCCITLLHVLHLNSSLIGNTIFLIYFINIFSQTLLACIKVTFIEFNHITPYGIFFQSVIAYVNLGYFSYCCRHQVN